MTSNAVNSSISDAVCTAPAVVVKCNGTPYTVALAQQNQQKTVKVLDNDLERQKNKNSMFGTICLIPSQVRIIFLLLILHRMTFYVSIRVIILTP